ncbi:unnamed protein product [Ceutorhynchus assimilis]|uniref:G-protein coupled receptors family 2 profile 2 domain-containing protein n=1 Tax=Ceutorhynchus assimilis TaxID=467358 RepID=A0A9P0DKH4_9CUCU|nr:unnamed protein product [Ceutorhynchus assimilis]
MWFVFLVMAVTSKVVLSQDDYSICYAKTCIRKCCDKNYVLTKNKTGSFCNLVNETLHHPVLHDKGFGIIYRESLCNWQQFPTNAFLDEHNLTFFENGTLLVPETVWGQEHLQGIHDYCADHLNGREGVLICLLDESAIQRRQRLIVSIGMIISMPFLLATFLVYAILPDRNLHQRALMFYVLTLLISYMLLVTINLSENINRPWCEIFGYLTLYFFMVSFFWMNVICFDIWYTFSGGRGFVGSKRTSERKRLLLYSLYAFGVPLLVALLVLLLQSKVLSESSEHNPGIGINKCFLGDGWPNLWYFYLEAGLLVLMNIIFFTLTALKIRQVKKETSMLKHNDSQRHSYEKDKQKFNLYVKLLFAMGVNWSMEVISWLVNWRTGNNIQYIWWATDFFNAVYGVFIFFMFVFKKKIWKLLQRRYYTFVGKPHLAHTMTTTNATRTSHYSSTNYSTTDTAVTDRTNVSNGNGRGRPEEMALRTVT